MHTVISRARRQGRLESVKLIYFIAVGDRGSIPVPLQEQLVDLPLDHLNFSFILSDINFSVLSVIAYYQSMFFTQVLY